MAQDQAIFNVGGRKLKFYLTGLNKLEYAKYKKLVHVRGGLVTRRLEQSLTWTFCKPEFYKILPRERLMYDIKYIDDCIKENIFKPNLLQYRLSKKKGQLGTSITITPIPRSSSTSERATTSVPLESNSEAVDERVTNPRLTNIAETAEASTDHHKAVPRIRSIVTSHIDLKNRKTRYLGSLVEQPNLKNHEKTPTQTNSTQKECSKSPSKELPSTSKTYEKFKKKRSRTVSERSSSSENKEETKRCRISPERKQNKRRNDIVEQILSDDLFSSDEENRTCNFKEKQKSGDPGRSPRLKMKEAQEDNIREKASKVIEGDSKKKKNSKKVNGVEEKAISAELIVISDESEEEQVPVRIGGLIEKKKKELEARQKLKASRTKKDSQENTVYPRNDSKDVPVTKVKLPRTIKLSNEIWRLAGNGKPVSDKSEEDKVQEKPKQTNARPFGWDSEIDAESDTDFTLIFDVENTREKDSEQKSNTKSKKNQIEAENPTCSQETAALKVNSQFDVGNLGSFHIDSETHKTTDGSNNTHRFDDGNGQSLHKDTHTVSHSQASGEDFPINTQFFEIENLECTSSRTEAVADPRTIVDDLQFDTQFLSDNESSPGSAETVIDGSKTMNGPEINTQFFEIGTIENSQTSATNVTEPENRDDDPTINTQFFNVDNLVPQEQEVKNSFHEKNENSDVDAREIRNTRNHDSCTRENLTEKLYELEGSTPDFNATEEKEINRFDKDSRNSNVILTQKLNEHDRNSPDLKKTAKQKSSELQREPPNFNKTQELEIDKHDENSQNLNKSSTQKLDILDISDPGLNTTPNSKTKIVENSEREPVTQVTDDLEKSINSLEMVKEKISSEPLVTEDTPHSTSLDIVYESLAEYQEVSPILLTRSKKLKSGRTCKASNETRVEVVEEISKTVSTEENTSQENVVSSSSGTSTTNKSVEETLDCKKDELKNEIEEEASKMNSTYLSWNDSTASVVALSSNKKDSNIDHDYYNHTLNAANVKSEESEDSLVILEAHVKIEKVKENLELTKTVTDLAKTNTLSSLDSVSQSGTNTTCSSLPTDTVSLGNCSDVSKIQTISVSSLNVTPSMSTIEKREEGDGKPTSLDSMNELSSNLISEDDESSRCAVSDRVLRGRSKRNIGEQSKSPKSRTKSSRVTEKKKESKKASPIKKRNKVIQGLNVSPIEITRFKETPKRVYSRETPRRVYSRKTNLKEKIKGNNVSPSSSANESSSNAEESQLNEKKIQSEESSGLNRSKRTKKERNREGDSVVKEQDVNVSTNMREFLGNYQLTPTLLKKNEKKIRVFKTHGNVAKFQLKPFSCRSSNSELLKPSSENVDSAGKTSAKKPKFVIIEKRKCNDESAGTSKRKLSISESKDSETESSNIEKPAVYEGYVLRMCGTSKHKSEFQSETRKAQNSDNHVNRTRKMQNVSSGEYVSGSDSEKEDASTQSKFPGLYQF